MSISRILRRAPTLAVAFLIAAAFLAVSIPKASCQQSGGSESATGSGNAPPQAQPQPAKGTQGKQAASPSKSQQVDGSKSKKSPTAQANPFPEAESKAAAKDNSNASPSSPPAGGYSSSDAGLPPSALGEEKLGSGSHKRLDSYTRDKTQDGRIADDLKVASFYMTNGNYRGALGRYQDALQYDPQNDTALYGVAEAMCRENRTTEAMAHFDSYAKNNPQGMYALKAEKMLAHPNKCKHNW